MRIDLTDTTAELARPEGPPSRGLVLHPDIFGNRPLFDDLCARLAAEHGWVVCAPEPFPGREHLTIEERMAVMGDLDDATQLGYLADAAGRCRVEGAGRVAVLGFCMGGMYALKAAAQGWADRAVSYYGMIHVPGHWQGPGQGDPLAALGDPAPVPVLAFVGGVDVWTPPADVADLEAVGNVTVVRYPEADHGFVHDPSRPTHRAADAADTWVRVAEFLA